jgi:hypothetical protein
MMLSITMSSYIGAPMMLSITIGSYIGASTLMQSALPMMLSIITGFRKSGAT